MPGAVFDWAQRSTLVVPKPPSAVRRCGLAVSRLAILERMKRLVASHSQHFLRSPAFIAELIGHSNLRHKDTVIDIGAGSGAITAVLARRVAHVIAYENESQAGKRLQEHMASCPTVEVRQEDFLAAELPDGPYKVFSNIPFHLSSSIVRKLVGAKVPPQAIYLIVQKQFAIKLVTDGDHFHAALGMAIAPWWTVRIRRPLRRTDYTPPPAVDTALIEIKPRPEPLLPHDMQERYLSFVERCYAEPRFYARTSAPKNKKPSQVTLEQWCAVFRQSAF